MMPPIVSILIPTYKQDQYIVRAIESALHQDYPHLEVIVSDDSSPDQTQAVVERFIAERGDPRLTYSRNEENIGILRNYHCGLYKKARGDWIVNLDGDDFFLDNGFISAAMSLAAANPEIKLIFADYAEYHQETGRKIAIKNGPHPEVMTDVDFFSRYAGGKVLWNHNSIIYRRAPAVQIGFYWDPAIPRNDWESFLRLIVGAKVGFLPRVVAAWVQHAANETRRLDIEKYTRNFALIDGIALFAEAEGMHSRFVNRWQRAMRYKTTKSSCIGYLRNRDVVGIAKFLRRAAQVDPVLPLRAATDLTLIGRAILAASPSLYVRAKQLAHRVRN